VNGFGPAHIEKSHFKGVFGCIFRQSLMKYGGNKSIKEKKKKGGGVLAHCSYDFIVGGFTTTLYLYTIKGNDCISTEL
jgi:hypothetical protein